MNINDFTIQLFNEHKAIINILIVEPHNQNIYSDKEKSYIAARTSDYNFKILTVREIIKIDDELYFHVEYKGKQIGFFKPVKSITLVPKYKRQININPEANFNNNLNTFLEIDQNQFEENRSRIAFSKYYAIFENQLFETIILSDELIGFLKSEEINNLFKKAKKFKVREDAMTYNDNTFTKKWKKIDASETTYTSKYIVPNEKKVKFKYSGKDVWIDENLIDIDYDILDMKLKDVNEILVESMLKQYADKMDEYHIYYNRMLAKEMKK